LTPKATSASRRVPIRRSTGTSPHSAPHSAKPRRCRQNQRNVPPGQGPRQSRDPSHLSEPHLVTRCHASS
jgi:hypothetical protein